MSETRTTTVQQFEDGTQVPQDGFAPLSTGGVTIPHTTNLLAGDGAGGVTNSGVDPESPVFGGSVTTEGPLTAAQLITDGGSINSDGAGNLRVTTIIPGNGFTGTVSPVTSITVVAGIITAAS